MMHVSNDEVYRLAELTEEMQPYNSDDLKMMEHIKTCKECYNRFCSMLAMIDVTSEAGYIMLSEIYGFSKDDALSSYSVQENVLAVVEVIRKKLNDSLTVMMEQVNQLGTRLQFVPAFAGVSRGVNMTETPIYKMEEAEDEKTFVVYDPKQNELMVQINAKNVETEALKVYVEFNDSTIVAVPMERKGNIFRGILTDISEMGFKIHIEKDE